MILEDNLYTFLSTYANLVAKVSTRVYPVRFPQATVMPCVVFQRISTPRELTHDMSGATGTLAHPRFQIEAWSETYDAGKDIVDILREALNGKTGALGAITIRAALVDDEAVEYSPDFELYRFSCDYLIWHEE